MDTAILYIGLKHLHMTAVAVSGAFFLVRGIWMLRHSDMLQRRWVRVAPHIVDTVLLLSALGLLWVLSLSPFAHGWLTAKIVALVLYIVAGSIALKRGRSRRTRIDFFAVAIVLFAYMVGVALTREPWFFLPS